MGVMEVVIIMEITVATVAMIMMIIIRSSKFDA